jgi:MSHA biogenesis protein MshI
LVLAAEFYQWVQLDKPAVADDEVMQALPWLVREFTELAPEDLLLDYVDVPVQPNQQQAKIQLVLTSRSRWQPLCQALQRRQLNLVNIQPVEWLSRNFIPKQAAAVMVLAHLPGQELSLQIIQQGAVFFSRKLRGFQRFDQYDFAELQQGLLDNLLLEVQRSLDYFEGQLRQAPVKEILFILASPTLPAIVDYFAKNGFSQVQPLPFGRYLPATATGNVPTMAELIASWPALAGALELLQEDALDEAQR